MPVLTVTLGASIGDELICLMISCLDSGQWAEGKLYLDQVKIFHEAEQ